jgi:tRNA pseudouridine38-40 synthase
MRIALGIEYDGASFSGWQIQDGTRTVQGLLEPALSKVADHPVRTICAGRTDAGVHALRQVAHIETDAIRTMRSWMLGGNSHLPPEVSITWAQPVAEDFHARFSARARHYRYVILNRFSRSGVWANRTAWEHRPLDEARMQAAARHLIGTHDFSAYRALNCQAKSPVRTIIRLQVRRVGERVIIEVSANAFLHHMVRNIAGVLMAIGMGKAEPDWAKQVLDSRDRTLGGVTAPPQGLYLCGVDYPAEYGLPGGSEPAWEL